MNTVETQHSPNNNKKEPIIKYGFSDDTLKRVKNVVINFKDNSDLDVAGGIDDTHYDRVNIQKSCDEIYITLFVNDNELRNELYINMDDVKNIIVKHFLKQELSIQHIVKTINESKKLKPTPDRIGVIK